MQNRHLADSQACGVPGSQPARVVLFLCVFPAADPSNLLYPSGHVRAHTHVFICVLCAHMDGGPTLFPLPLIPVPAPAPAPVPAPARG